MDQSFSKATEEQVKRRLRPIGANSENIFEGRIPPYAKDLEEAVLGAMMLEREAVNEVIDILKPESFYVDAHKKIYAAIVDLFKESQPIDILTVTNFLKKKGELEFVGGPFYVTQLTSRVASSANVEFHARIISQKHIQRELIRISSETIKMAYDDSFDVFDMLDKAESNLFAIADSSIKKKYATISDLMSIALKDIESAKNQDGHVVGVPSGFTDLDKITAGWQKSDLLIIAARPGMGKTAFVLSMARNIAVDHQRPVALFSLEMSAVQLVNRLIASESMLDQEKLKRGDLQDHEWHQLHSKVGKLAKAPIIIDDTPSLSILELRAKCRRLKEEHKIQIIIIDYLQLMSAGDNKGNREQEISTISRSLKALAKELDVPIIALSQLSRAVESRGGSKRPQLSDLRESGAIEQDADMVMFIYRPEYYQMEEDENGLPTKDVGYIIIAKHRNGSLGDVRLKFMGRYAKFDNFEEENFLGTNNLTPNNEFENSGNIILKSKAVWDDDEAPF